MSETPAPEVPTGMEKLPPYVPAATFSEAIGRHMTKHSQLYVITGALGAQAFFTGFYDNFWIIEPVDMAKLGWWQVAAAFMKSLSFAIGIAVGYILKPTEPSK